nr:hypothetical protein [Bradyrhizobium diazoefficiens]
MMGLRRRRFKQADSLEDRLAKFAQDMRNRAGKEPPGLERNQLLKRAYSADQAVELDRQLRVRHQQ